MSRFRFKGAGLIQALIIIGLAIPNIMIVMPLFSIVNALNLSGTHFTLIFLYTATTVAVPSPASGRSCSRWPSPLL